MSLSSRKVVTENEPPRIQHSEEDRSILSWISTLDMELKHSEHRRMRINGIGEWFLQSDEFKEWSSEDSQTSVLWCPGYPGTGKTMRTSIVIDYLSRNRLNSDTALAFVYCDKTRPDETALDLLSSICRQLASQKSELPLVLRKLYKQMTHEDERPGIDDTMLVILSLCDSFSSVFICVDALDECDPNGERPILVSKLQWMRNHSARIFMTSRWYHKAIPASFEHDYQIETKATSQDIRTFLHQRLYDEMELYNLSSEVSIPADSIIDLVIERCGGMYLMAHLLLRKELVSLSAESYQRAPRLLPRDAAALDFQGLSVEGAAQCDRKKPETWQSRLHIITEREPLRRRLALITLSWIVYAKKPLRASELMQALSMDAEAENLAEDPDTWLVRDEEILLDMCEGLMVIRSENHETCLAEDCDMHSIRQELEELCPRIQLDIAKSCLRFLASPEVIASDQKDTYESEEDIKFKASRYPFKWYAKQYWGMHVKDCDDEILHDWAIQYLRKLHTNPARWIEEQSTWFGKASYIARTDDETPLHKAARFGLDSVLEKLLPSEEFDVNTESWREETAVCAAACAGHTSTVQLLYRHGANIYHLTQPYGYTLLHAAAENDDELMVALLVNYGMDPNIASGHDPETPLHRAADNNSVCAARMLLDYGANMHTPRRDGDAMRTVARKGYEDFVRLLVEYGFDLSAPTVSDDTPLLAATDSGSTSLIEYMMASGANIFEVEDGRKVSPIHRAAANGHIGIVKLLLDRGADPFQQGEGHTTALEAAISKNREDVVDLLLPRMGDEIPTSAILAMVDSAIQAKSPETAKKLLLKVPGNLANSFRSFKNSLLWGALDVDDEEMVELLLDRGELISHQNDHGWSPLHYAADLGAKAATVLLKRGANPNLRAEAGVTPVHIAAYNGELQVLTSLLNHGSDLSIRAEDGSNALIAAGYGSKPEAVKLLLQYGAPTSDFNIDGESVLHHAIMGNDAALVEILLQHDIDASIQCRKGGSALHLTAFKGFLDILQQLLDHGSDVELAYHFDGNGYTPSESYGVWEGIPWNQAGVESHDRPRYWSRIERGWTVLHSAACGGHINIVNKLLRWGAKVSARGQKGETPLHVAASAGHVETVKALLKCGANVSYKNVQGDTPLHSAALAAAASAAEKAERHFKCNCQLEKEEAGKHEDHSKVDCIALLLDHGADPACENQESLTPLALAATAGHEDVVKLLVHGPLLSRYSSTVYVSVLEACVTGSTAAALDIVSAAFAESDESRSVWCDILNNACLSGNHEMVSLALRKGAVLSLKTANDVNPFHHAIKEEQVEIVELLLDAGANLAATDADGRNALHIASSHRGRRTLTVLYDDRKKAQIVSALLDHGAPVNHRTPNGDTALHFAVPTGDGSVVDILLRGGASVNIRNKRGSTPLHAAVSTWVFPPIVEMLLADGACPTVQDHAGRTPLHLIKDWKEARQIVELLLQYGADCSIHARNGDRAIHCATRRARWDVVKQLLGAGASVNDEGQKGRRAIHVAAKHGHVTLIDPLIRLGSDVNAIDWEGWTPVHYATHEQHVELLSTLLKHPCLSMSKIKAKATSMASAVQHGNTEIMKLLVEAGAL
jgi:ankyrin repeat protein